MKTHYTAKELESLPGLPATESAIIRQAKREAWPARKRAGRGGGKEYPVTALPIETREHLTRSTITNAPAVRKAAPLPAVQTTSITVSTPAQLKQWQRVIMDARVAIMHMIQRAAQMIGVNKAINTIVTASINGELPPEYTAANARKGQGRALSYDGVMKWWMSWKKSGGNSLVLAPKDRAMIIYLDHHIHHI